MHDANESFSLYVHIPYCISKCPYCDFNSHVVANIPEKSYTESLIKELDHYAALDDWHGRTIRSIFFGGGTPSTFQPGSIDKILEQVAAQWALLPDCEITLESNQRRHSIFSATPAQVSWPGAFGRRGKEGLGRRTRGRFRKFQSGPHLC